MLFDVLAFVGLALWKRRLNGPGGPLTPEHLALDAYQVAALEGDRAALDAAVLSLVHAGVLRAPQEGGLSISGSLPRRAPAIERAVHHQVSQGKHSRKKLLAEARPALGTLRDSLRGLGLLRTPEQDADYQRLPARVFLAVLALGVAKVWVGLTRERPVGALVLLLLVGMMAWGILRLIHHPRSRRGDAVWEALQDQHAALRTTASSEGSAEAMRPQDVALAAGLFGVGTLAFLRGKPLRDYLMPETSGSCQKSCQPV